MKNFFPKKNRSVEAEVVPASAPNKPEPLTRRVELLATMWVNSGQGQNAAMLMESELRDLFGDSGVRVDVQSKDKSDIIELSSTPTVSYKLDNSHVYAQFGAALTDCPGKSVFQHGDSDRDLIVRVKDI